MKPLDLQLNVNEIPEAGVSIALDLPAEWITPSLLPAYSAGGDGKVTAEVQRMGDNAFVRGTVRVPVTFACSRTLEPAEETLDVPFAELFVKGEARELNLADADISSDDLEDEPWVIQGSMIDIEALIREHIVLAQDPYPLHPSQRPDVEEDEDAPEGDAVETTPPLWSSAADAVDPRWEKLRGLKLES
jgi:uncharacterized metal-binding protein YceD (DUF177 family)